ncbi:MAG: Ca-activated chloride channel family protein [Bradymonadia bacterium]|jgi:Ca-activated chloride channel family protein
MHHNNSHFLTSKTTRAVFWFSVLAALSACGADAESVPAGTAGNSGNEPNDWGTTADAGSADTGSDWGSEDAGGWAEADAEPWPQEDAGSWDAEEDSGSWADSDSGVESDAGPDPEEPEEEPIANTNINLGGDQDFGYFRRQLDDGIVPVPGTFDASGFFAEHHTLLPTPDCGERVCVQPMLGVLSNLINGNDCTMMQIGLNSPIAANPANRPPLSLTVVVDVSGSMNGAGKMGYVRDGLDIMVDSLRDGDRIAIVTYSDDAETVLPMTEVALNRGDLRAVVASLATEGSTNLFAGLNMGYEIAHAEYDSGRQNRVILLSDGEPTVGITSEESILAMSRDYNVDGIGLTTIGLGSDFQYSLMSNLARLGDGNFYFVENPAAVEEVFADEISFFTVPVAYDLTLEFEEGSDYQIAAVHGSDRWSMTPDGGRLEIPSVFLAHRVSHDDVTPGGGRRGGGSALMIELMPHSATDDGSGLVTGDIGEVTLSFREPGSDEIITQQATMVYPHSPWFILSTGFFEAPQNEISIIQKSFVMLNIYAAFEMSTDAFYRFGEAEFEVEMLQGLLSALYDYNEEIEDTDIAYDIALLEQFISVLLDNGAVPLPPEWEEPENPWPCD